MPTSAGNVAAVEDALNYASHQLDVKRIEVFLMRQEVEDSYTSAKERVRMLEPGANKLYWERRIEQGKELVDDEIRIRGIVARQLAILVERLKEAMKLDCP